MPEYILDPYVKWFENHVAHHRYMAEGGVLEMVKSKEAHTWRVLEHVREIRKESGASEDLCFAMEVAAVLHDVGRFPQLVGHGTYDDTGFNHAEESERIVRDSGLLESLPTSLREAILEAVKLHNLGVLPGDLAPDACRVLEVLRDADKLDAVRNILRCLNPDAPHGKALKSGLTWDEEKVSPMVLEAAKKRQLIAFNSIRWSNDFVLFVCCWLYDLHYNYSYRQLIASGNYDALLGKMPDDEPFVEVKAQLREDLLWIEARSRQP